MPIKPKQAKLFPFCTNTEYAENSAKMYDLFAKLSGGIYKIHNKNGGVKKMVGNAHKTEAGKTFSLLHKYRIR